ncbi:P68 family surface lipoprotein [Mycoplasmopsis bovis]|uniref:P68 family surface lipoprotein n=1 Tax=Mycoplasmopsis bovis TaxID=28903 RepID=UPI00244E8D1C|nr:variable surface lipoprotein [Mycoplasmopsis bovis]
MKAKKLLWGIAPLMALAPIVAAKCGDGNETKSIVFQIGHRKSWPLSGGLAPFAEYYNKTFKGQKDFMPVKMSYADDHNTTSEFVLARRAKDNIESGNFKDVPNIILGAQSGAYVINQYNRLMDLSDVGIKKDIFNQSIADLHSILSGQADKSRVYNIPFDNADTDALAFNLDALYFMLKMIEDGKGEVDWNADIPKRAKDAAQPGVGNDLPEKSIWRALKLKEGEPFKGFKVDEKTFKSMEKIRELAVKFHEGTTLEESKVDADTITGEVLSIDYNAQAFLKEFKSRIGKTENDVIWKLVLTGDQKKPTRVEYNLPNIPEYVKIFKDLWETYTTKSIKRHVKKINENSKVFSSIKYMEHGIQEWGSWNIREFKSAISILASVGTNQRMLSSVSRKLFSKLKDGTPVKDFEKNNAKFEDVYLLPQLTVMSEGKDQIFAEGGSSILAVDTSKERDTNTPENRATKKFLSWLYTGKNTHTGTEEENWKTFAKLSGYIMPLKNVISDANEKWMKEEIDRLLKEVREIEKKPNATEAEKEVANKKFFTLNNLRSALVSLQSILNLEKNKDKVLVKASVTDDATSQIAGSIDKALYRSTIHDGQEIASADKLVEGFKQSVQNTPK